MDKMPSLWDSTRDGQDALSMGQHQIWARCPIYGTAPDGQDALFMGQYQRWKRCPVYGTGVCKPWSV